MTHHLVAALIIDADRILLGQRSAARSFYPSVWDVFGGHIEADESPEQALVRELQEELNITPTQWQELETIRDSVPMQESGSFHELIVHLYCVTGWIGTPINHATEEHSTIEWFSYAEAVLLNLAHPGYPRLFARCLGVNNNTSAE